LEIEISALSPMRRVGRAEDIEVGRHGVLLSKGGSRAVFLPQVAPSQGWDREQTLNHLAEKAGLAADAWRKGARFDVFEATVFAEHAR
jgi:AMMECR1 domain-containing protein